jgi:hypothetical protein
MKLFSTLSDTDKERAIHMAEHIVLDDFLENGVNEEPENEEEQERLEEAEKAIAHVKTLGSDEEKAEFLFENSATGEMILERAYQIASSSIFIEENETAFFLKEMSDHFGNKDKSAEEGESSDSKPVEALISNAPKKDMRHLN